MYLNEEENREVKEDTSRPAKERVSLFRRWDKIVNMKSADIAAFRSTDLGKSVGLNRNEAQAAGLNVLSGQEASKKIEKMISKASKFRKQSEDKIPKLPNWTDDEWDLAGRQIGMISRFRENIGPLEDDDGNLTPKAGAMKLWGRDELNATGKFPDKTEENEAVKELYKQAREEDKVLEKKKKEKEAAQKKSNKEVERKHEKAKKNALTEEIQIKANYLLS